MTHVIELQREKFFLQFRMSHTCYITLENNTGQFQDKCKFVTYAGANFLLHINNHTHVQSGGLNMIRWIVENWKQNDIMATPHLLATAPIKRLHSSYSEENQSQTPWSHSQIKGCIASRGGSRIMQRESKWTEVIQIVWFSKKGHSQ